MARLPGDAMSWGDAVKEAFDPARERGPAPERKDDLLEITAPVGERVDVRRRRRRELVALDDARALEFAQAIGDDVGARVREASLEIGETLRPEQQLADHEQRPALADEIESVGDRAAIAVCTLGRHVRTHTRAS